MHEPGQVTEVPDVVGLGADDACEIVRRAGLVPVPPEGVAELPMSGIVTAQRPVGAAGAVTGGEVVLWVHPGREASVGAGVTGPVESGSPDPV
ncbi:PASTA domain-containing protein [Saccharomonospora saliphila]|uniref:PASTA domain-containing protein n=1 Tax=Saccharomonospora saliphila TaxID=369829 RepID=UPI00049172C1|nr:PASTA domain-containing protein [Saccharomonospora saliphila]